MTQKIDGLKSTKGEAQMPQTFKIEMETGENNWKCKCQSASLWQVCEHYSSGAI